MPELVAQILVLVLDITFPQPINSNIFNYFSQETTISEQNYEMPNELVLSDYVYVFSDAMFRSKRQGNFTNKMEYVWLSDFKGYLIDENINLIVKNERNVFDEKFFTNRRLSKKILSIDEVLSICENCKDVNQVSMFPIISVMKATDYDDTGFYRTSNDLDLYLVKLDLYTIKNKQLLFHKSVVSYFLQNKNMQSLGFNKKQFQIIVHSIVDEFKYYADNKF